MKIRKGAFKLSMINVMVILFILILMAMVIMIAVGQYESLSSIEWEVS